MRLTVIFLFIARMFKYLVFLNLAFLFICCQSIESKIRIPDSINLTDLPDDWEEVPVSRFIDNLEFIPLEFTPKCPITYLNRIHLLDEYIIARSGNSVFLFNRNTGEFIREIGRIGTGPIEHMAPLECFLNPFNNNIYTYGNTKATIKVYDLNGKYLRSFSTLIPNNDNLAFLPISAFQDSSIYIGYIENDTGSQKRRIIIFSEKNVIVSFLNHEKWLPENICYRQNPRFFFWKDRVSFKELSNDTVFYISNNILVPRYVLVSGDRKVPYYLAKKEALKQLSEPAEYIQILNLFESTRYLFFEVSSQTVPSEANPGNFKHIRNFCIYDKELHVNYVCKNNESGGRSGLVDDLYGFLSFCPQSISENNELLGWLYSTEVYQWKLENQNKLSQLSAELPWLEELEITDNPIVIIARLKVE